MATNPIGGMIRNLITLQRLGNGVSADAESLLRALFEDIAGHMAKLDPSLPADESYRRARLEQLLGELNGIIGQSFDSVHRLLRERIAAIGAHQEDWAHEQLSASLASVSVDVRSGQLGRAMIESIIDSDPFQGETLKGWTDTQAEATVRRVRRQLQLGMAQNETLDQMIVRIRGSYAGRSPSGEPRFKDGILEATTRETEAIARTGINFIANRAHAATYRENADILQGLEVVAVLDSRTTMICASKDGEILPPDSTDLPPYHYNCRTVVVAKVAWERLGIEPPKEGMRASADGPVKSSTTYEDWLRKQSAEVQDEVLGPARAKLFRAGKINLRDLVKQDRSIVTLDELRRRAG